MGLKSDFSFLFVVNHPQEVLQKGQTVDVVVQGVDAENRKITLGLKQLQESPWNDIAAKFPVGAVIASEVVMNSNFGVFVKLEGDIEALVYSSEIDKTQAAALKAGDKLQVKVIKVDVEGMKIGVSARL